MQMSNPKMHSIAKERSTKGDEAHKRIKIAEHKEEDELARKDHRELQHKEELRRSESR